MQNGKTSIYEDCSVTVKQKNTVINKNAKKTVKMSSTYNERDEKGKYDDTTMLNESQQAGSVLILSKEQYALHINKSLLVSNTL